MNKKNVIIGLVVIAVIILGVILLVPRNSGNEADAARDCSQNYGYDKHGKPCKPKKPKPLLFDILKIGD